MDLIFDLPSDYLPYLKIYKKQFILIYIRRFTTLYVLPAIAGRRVILTVGSLRSQTISVFKEQLGFVNAIFGELM